MQVQDTVESAAMADVPLSNDEWDQAISQMRSARQVAQEIGITPTALRQLARVYGVGFFIDDRIFFLPADVEQLRQRNGTGPIQEIADNQSLHTCKKCGLDYPASHFLRRRTRVSEKALGVTDPWSLGIRCQTCRDTAARRYARDHQQKVYTPERGRRINLKAMYGLSPEDVDAISEEQGHVCAICGRPPRGRSKQALRLHVDHDHTTGAIRGLLCQSCNTALGHFNDSPDTLARAITYLNRQPRNFGKHRQCSDNTF